MRQRLLRITSGIGGVVALLALFPGIADAQDGPTPESVQAFLDNTWVLIAGILVFLMQAGFALVEAGLTRSKNVVNIFAKNLADALIGVLCFFAVGYAIAFGGGADAPRLFGNENFFLNGVDGSIDGGLSGYTVFFFQSVFAATAVTIASGAMAERTKFASYLVFSAVMTAFIYPVVVHWTWGGGMIANMQIGDAVFSDFAGSTIVHMTGGVAALMGAIFLGPRIGKYDENGKPRAIPGHNIPFAILGVFILWFGWFGFNPGSELAADAAVAGIAVNTMLAACAGGVTSTIAVWMKTGKPDLSMIGNGVLAGLVAITAGCGTMTPVFSIVTGGIGGVIVVFAVLGIERIRVDDPVGAFSVHGICGIWGTLAIGLFAKYDDAFLGREDAGLIYGGGLDQLLMQGAMVLIVAAWVVATTSITFLVLEKTIGLRVSREEELEGLDVLEHGLPGYPDDVNYAA